jgi:putative PIN family toxin of toxin-antitoxin system
LPFSVRPWWCGSQLITSWGDNKFQWIITENIVNELKEVLKRDKIRNKYNIDEQDAKTFLESLSIGAEIISPIPLDSLPIHSRDKKDDPLLACAFGGKSDYLITGDEDLLVLDGRQEVGKLRIIKAADFLQTIM